MSESSFDPGRLRPRQKIINSVVDELGTSSRSSRPSAYPTDAFPRRIRVGVVWCELVSPLAMRSDRRVDVVVTSVAVLTTALPMSADGASSEPVEDRGTHQVVPSSHAPAIRQRTMTHSQRGERGLLIRGLAVERTQDFQRLSGGKALLMEDFHHPHHLIYAIRGRDQYTPDLNLIFGYVSHRSSHRSFLIGAMWLRWAFTW